MPSEALLLPGFERQESRLQLVEPEVVTPQRAAPRPYQAVAITAILRALSEKRSALVVMATGLGKSWIIAEVARLARRPVLVVADGDILVDNLVEKIQHFTGEKVDLEQQDWRASHAKIVVASLRSITDDDRLARLATYGFGLVIIDEAHRALAPGYAKVIQALPGAKILGLTATPRRHDKKALGHVFETCAYQYDLVQAIDDGWLCSFEFLNPKIKEIDFSNVKNDNGDLSPAAVQAIIGGERELHGIVESTINVVGDRPTIMFAPSIQIARRMTEIFNRYRTGSAHVVDSNDMMSRDERRKILKGFRDREYQFFVNVNVATEGFDAPCTAAIGMTAPTLSELRYKQQMGRGARGGRNCPEPGKTNCLILDYAGNVGRHGIVTPAYVLAGRFGVEVQEIAARIQREAPEKKTEQIIAEAREEREARLDAEMKQRRFIVARVNFEVESIDPFKIIKVALPSEYMADTSGPPSAKQIERLEKWKMLRDLGDRKLTSKAVNALIRKEAERRKAGKAHWWVVRWGLRYGYDLHLVTMTRALMLYKAVKENGGRQVGRELAHQILLGRETGEDG